MYIYIYLLIYIVYIYIYIKNNIIFTMNFLWIAFIFFIIIRVFYTFNNILQQSFLIVFGDFFISITLINSLAIYFISQRNTLFSYVINCFLCTLSSYFSACWILLINIFYNNSKKDIINISEQKNCITWFSIE